jgi:uncharacterized membrane-anchored protein YhcB (DUF1043 family)
MTGDKRTCWLNPRMLLTVFLIFLSGGMAGALVMRFGIRALPQSNAVYYPVGDRKVALQQLTNELELSPAQVQQLESILDDFVMYVQMLQAQMDEVRANGKYRVMRVLDEKQQKKFEKMLGVLQQARR